MHSKINGRAVPYMSLHVGFALQTGLRLLVLIALDGPTYQKNLTSEQAGEWRF